MRIPNDTIADREFLTVDPALALSAGAWIGTDKVNKFGYAPDGVQILNTDIWDRSDAAVTQRLWAAPGSSVQHNIASTSALDASGSIGAKEIRVFGLPDWDSKEVSELITMNGGTPVLTVNSYVIIHRMFVTQYGSVGPNAGIITATTNDVATTITAQINVGWGQTEMAIYGIPSIQSAYVTNWYASIQKASGATTDVNFKLQFAQDPVTYPGQFVTKEIRGLQSDGSSNGAWLHNPYKKIEGPGIIKIQANASANDIDCTAGFDLILLDN